MVLRKRRNVQKKKLGPLLNRAEELQHDSSTIIINTTTPPTSSSAGASCEAKPDPPEEVHLVEDFNEGGAEQPGGRGSSDVSPGDDRAEQGDVGDGHVPDNDDSDEDGLGEQDEDSRSSGSDNEESVESVDITITSSEEEESDESADDSGSDLESSLNGKKKNTNGAEEEDDDVDGRRGLLVDVEADSGSSSEDDLSGSSSSSDSDGGEQRPKEMMEKRNTVSSSETIAGGSSSASSGDSGTEDASVETQQVKRKQLMDDVCARVPISCLGLLIVALHTSFRQLVLDFDPRYGDWYLPAVYSPALCFLLWQLGVLLFGGAEKQNYVPKKWGFQYRVEDLARWLHQRTSDGRLRGCVHCGGFKPDRAQHCRVTGRCVLKLDHWCPFLLQTIGFHSYMPFVRLLATAVFLLGFMTYHIFAAVTQVWIRQYFLRHQGGNLTVAVCTILAASVPVFAVLLWGVTVFRLARAGIPTPIRVADAVVNLLALAALYANERLVVPYATENYPPIYAVTTQTVLGFLTVLLFCFLLFHLHLGMKNQTTFEHWAAKRGRVPVTDWSLGSSWKNLRSAKLVLHWQFWLPVDLLPVERTERLWQKLVGGGEPRGLGKMANRHNAEEDVDMLPMFTEAELREAGYLFDTLEGTARSKEADKVA